MKETRGVKVQAKTDPSHFEMVGAMLKSFNGVGEIITTDRGMIKVALSHDCPVFWVSRWHAQFMADCDMGQNWRKLANAPTLWNNESLHKE